MHVKPKPVKAAKSMVKLGVIFTQTDTMMRSCSPRQHFSDGSPIIQTGLHVVAQQDIGQAMAMAHL